MAHTVASTLATLRVSGSCVTRELVQRMQRTGAMSKRLLQQFASAVVILNLLDALFTLAYTHAGLAVESNPMMQAPLAASPTLFILAKVTLVSLCVLLLWRLGPRKPTVIAMAGAATTYMIVLAYHLTAVPQLVAAL